MVTLAELLTQICEPSEVKTPSGVPGVWEELQTDFTDLDWDPIWSHSLDKGFSDCILGVEFDDRYLMNIVISRPKFEWRVHQSRVKKGRELQRIVVIPPMSDSTIQQVHTAVVDGISQTRRSWKKCKHCGGRQPSAYMQEAGVCMGCAPTVLGLVY
ncbi:hypothetical protein N9D44_00225 [Pontimonas sp.]|nr:hypothetical protein [Pontimonas sp.]